MRSGRTSDGDVICPDERERAEHPERHDLYAALVEAAKRADPTNVRFRRVR
jgi:hypothetical protein